MKKGQRFGFLILPISLSLSFSLHQIPNYLEAEYILFSAHSSVSTMESTIVMMMMITRSFFCFLGFLCLLCSSVHGLLSPKGVNFEGNVHQQNLPPLLSFSFFLPKTCFSFFVSSLVVALIGIKSSLTDPHGVLMNWDDTAVDPCSWNMITCSDGLS